MSDSQVTRQTLSYHLERARSLASEDRFDEALQTLRDAYKLADLTEDDIGQIEAVGQEVEEIRQKRVQALTRDLETLLAKKPEELTPADLDAGQETLARLQGIHPNPVDLEPLPERWQAHYRRTQIWLDMEATRRELDELWKAPYILLSRYDKALALARQKATEYPDEVAFQELLREAEQKRDQAYREEELLTTQAAQGEFKPLMEELKRGEREGRETLPWYDWGTRETDGKRERVLVEPREVPAREAIQRLGELARKYEDDKADEYIGRAQAELPAYPEAADKWIQDALSFEYISTSKKDELQTYWHQTIERALENRQRANELVQNALRPEVIIKDVEAAWGFLDQATEVDQYAPAIGKARNRLRPRLKVHLEGLLRRAAEKRQAGDFETAEDIASHVRKVAERDKLLQEIAQQAQDLVKKCDADQDFFETIQAEAKQIAGLVDTDLAAAIQALADLEARVAGRPERFQQVLRGTRYAVQARQSLEALLAGWEQCFQAIDPTRLDESEAIHQAIDELDRLADEVRQAITERGRKPELAYFQERIAARRRFLQGRLDWENGLYQRAKDAWQLVVKAEKADKEDISLAEEWLKQAEDAAAVSQAITQAQEHRKNKNYEQSLALLKEWRAKASPKQRDVQDLYRQIETEWADQLKAKIEKLIADIERRPAYRVLVEKVNQLANLRPENARYYQHEYFPRIYEEWGDQAWQAGEYAQAEEYYQQAVDLVHGEVWIRLNRKLYQARRQQAYHKIDKLIADGKRDEARQRLTEWVGKVPNNNDVQSLAWLADLFLEDEEYKRAAIYIQQAEHRLETAEREKNPDQAGLEQVEEITEWRLRLEALRVKTQAVADINQAKLRITERLRPDTSLREYRLAQETKDGLVERLKQTEKDMRQQEKEHPLLPSLSQAAQKRVHRAWRGARHWLGEQFRTGAGISAWYDGVERDLLGGLREIWKHTESPDIGSLTFRLAPPAAALKKRWEVGFKIRFLFREGEEGEAALREVSSVLSHLRDVSRQLMEDSRGPESDLNGTPLGPLDSLTAQLRWSKNLLEWARTLGEVLESYAWATEEKDRPERQGDETGVYQNARQIYPELRKFREALLDLMDAVNQARGRLDRAIAAGQDGRRRWEHIHWSALVVHILQSPRTPLPVNGDGQEMSRDYWQNLEHDDMDVRWDAWRKAAEAFQQMKLADRHQEAPWEVINPLIIQAGIEEGWADVGAPLKEHLVRFGRHRAVRWVLEERSRAEEKRNQLVLAVVALYTLVQAEEFRAALARIGQIELLDPKNEYGFQSGYLVKEPDRLSWEELKESLQARQRQWEQFQTWWAGVESSALRPWQAESQTQVIELVRKAAFEEAIQLSQDALEGTQAGGRTNRLGGGLALEPLLQYLESRPPELQQPLSHRLRRALAEADGWHHDVQEAVDELRFWLKGTVGQHRSRDIPEPIEELQKRFLDEKGALDGALRELEGRWRFWQKNDKEAQRQYCLELLAGLRKVAPHWPGLEKYEQRIREA